MLHSVATAFTVSTEYGHTYSYITIALSAKVHTNINEVAK